MERYSTREGIAPIKIVNIISNEWGTKKYNLFSESCGAAIQEPISEREVLAISRKNKKGPL